MQYNEEKLMYIVVKTSEMNKPIYTYDCMDNKSRYNLYPDDITGSDVMWSFTDDSVQDKPVINITINVEYRNHLKHSDIVILKERLNCVYNGETVTYSKRYHITLL